MEEILSLFFRGVIVMFTIASTLLAGYSFQNKLRLRKVRLSWRAGKLQGYPLFATVFLGIVLGLSAIVVFTGDIARFPIFFAYAWIGTMWFISSYLASKYYITDYGIVKNINEPSQTIPWFQILDYVERPEKNGVEYLFNYSEMDKSLIEGYKQLKLFVPRNRYKAVKKIVSLKLENKIEGQAIPDIDLKRIQED
ncbi:MAG: hypothetical protein JJ953_14945 [Gracilimonas sp.]|uniref:hypothetical protein n=1 Tax=Gracilimonas TaxID=649462 RepID=UPI001B2509A0|nr:hypothetical protein [Gracilimonas sp.]MBO6587406.1 hypothetical protein [Gracilimonas sp.]MBO6614108.1 hypothetical protein [Gracilimonas sp.]